MGGYGGVGGVGTGWSVLGLLGQLGFVLLLLGGGYLLYRAFVGGRGNTFGRTDSAMQELRHAYARGELSDEQFETRRNRLQERGEP